MESDSIKKLYEIGYLLMPLIPEDKVVDEVNALRSYVENAGGFIVLEGQPVMRKLSYEISQRGIADKKGRFEDAYFGWIRFQATPVEAVFAKESIDKNYRILRFLIVKSVKDGTRIVRAQNVTRPKQDLVKKEIVSLQELDKEIDLLLSEKTVSV